MEQWVTAFEHIATCSDAAAATLADQRPGCRGANAHTTYEACDDMSLYLRTLPESVCGLTVFSFLHCFGECHASVALVAVPYIPAYLRLISVATLLCLFRMDYPCM